MFNQWFSCPRVCAETVHIGPAVCGRTRNDKSFCFFQSNHTKIYLHLKFVSGTIRVGVKSGPGRSSARPPTRPRRIVIRKLQSVG